NNQYERVNELIPYDKLCKGFLVKWYTNNCEPGITRAREPSFLLII
ncbi:19959_t:CDS:1, partial [Racocetra persica]